MAQNISDTTQERKAFRNKCNHLQGSFNGTAFSKLFNSRKRYNLIFYNTFLLGYFWKKKLYLCLYSLMSTAPVYRRDRPLKKEEKINQSSLSTWTKHRRNLMMCTNHFTEWDLLSKTAESFSCIEAILASFSFPALSHETWIIINRESAPNIRVNSRCWEIHPLSLGLSRDINTKLQQKMFHTTTYIVHQQICQSYFKEMQCKVIALRIQHSITRMTAHSARTSTNLPHLLSLYR